MRDVFIYGLPASLCFQQRASRGWLQECGSSTSYELFDTTTMAVTVGLYGFEQTIIDVSV